MPIAAVAIVYAATLAMLPAGGLWIVDNGNKRIQAEALLASGFRDFSLPWPGLDLDPDLAFNPLPNAFSIVRDGRLYSVFSPVFPALSALPFRWFGDAGLCLLPLLASLALLVGVGRIAALGALPPPGRSLAILIAGLATPLWFYAVVLIALAAGFRDSLLLFAAVLGALLWCATRRGRLRTGGIFVAGLAAGLLPLALFQWLALGDPLGFHLTHGFAAHAGEASGFGFHLRTRLAVFHNLFLAAADGPALSALLTAPFAILLLVRPRLSGRSYLGVALATAGWALVGMLVTGFGYATAQSPIERLLLSNGFFAAAPLLVVGLVRRREDSPASASDRIVGWSLHLTLAYALLYFALTPVRNTTGIHWGNRYLLELYALLAVPCAAALHTFWRGGSRARSAAALLGLLAVGSVALQVFSLDLLRRKLEFVDRLERAVRDRPEQVILTDQWWLPQTLAHEFFDRSTFYLPSRESSRILLERLAQRGIGAFLFVTTDVGRPPEPSARVIDDGGLGFFSLRLEHHSLHRPGPGVPPPPSSR